MSETQTKKEVETEPVATQAVEATPKQAEAVYVTPVQTASAPAKSGGFGWGKCFLVGCAALLLCCCCTVIFAVVAPNLLLKTVTGGNKAPDATLTRLTSLLEYNNLVTAINSETSTANQTDPVTGLLMLKLNEKEAIAFLYSTLIDSSSTNTSGTPMQESDIGKLGIKFTPGNAKIQMDLSLLGALMASTSTESGQNFDPKTFEGINVTVDIGTTADNTNITINDFSTGNSIIDSVLNSGIKQQLIDSIQESMSEPSTDGSTSPFARITFLQGSMEMVFTDTTDSYSTP